MSGINRQLLERCGEKFIFAAKNERAFDQIYYRQLGLSAADYFFIPRPSKWVRRFPWALNIIRLSSKFLAYGWSYVLFYVYVIAKIVVVLIRRRPKSYNSYGIRGAVVFAICDRSCYVLSRICESSGTEVWLCPNRAVISEKSRNGIKLGPFEPVEFLKPSEIFQLTKQALKTHKEIVAEYGAGMGLQSYVLVDWLLMLAATIMLSPKKILTAEHHDKWAVLADIYCMESKELGGHCELELAQHGKEYKTTYELMEEIVGGGLPYRLKNVSKIHLYDSEQQQIFKKNIISESSPGESGGIVYEILEHKIELSECGINGIKVLFVGHPICEKFQTELYRLIEKKTTASFFYKPHPTVPASKYVEAIGWNLIADNDFFPKVDLVISYPSTLADEYKSVGAPVVIHSLDAAEEDLEQISQSVNKILCKLGVKS